MVPTQQGEREIVKTTKMGVQNRTKRYIYIQMDTGRMPVGCYRGLVQK